MIEGDLRIRQRENSARCLGALLGPGQSASKGSRGYYPDFSDIYEKNLMI
jgi:hypothetical protein